MSKTLILTSQSSLYRILMERLVFITAEGDKSRIVTQDNRSQLIPLKLGQMERVISDLIKGTNLKYFRVGRGLIINSDFISTIDLTRGQLILSDCHSCFYELNPSLGALSSLKDFFTPSTMNETENDTDNLEYNIQDYEFRIIG